MSGSGPRSVCMDPSYVFLDGWERRKRGGGKACGAVRAS